MTFGKYYIDEVGAWTGKESISWTEENVRSYDLAMIAIHHDALDLCQLLEWCDLIVDTRNAVATVGRKPFSGRVYKA